MARKPWARELISAVEKETGHRFKMVQLLETLANIYGFYNFNQLCAYAKGEAQLDLPNNGFVDRGVAFLLAQKWTDTEAAAVKLSFAIVSNLITRNITRESILAIYRPAARAVPA